MGNLALFFLATLIWGSTWIAITFQLPGVAPEVSVTYRFALAAALLALWCAATGRSLRFSFAQHRAIAAQGTLLFGLNYLLVYWAERYIASGLMAVLFSLLVFFNLLGVRIFFGTMLSSRVLIGAALGIAGVGLLFWPELRGNGSGGDATLGILCGVGATILASGGNLTAARNHKAGIPVLAGTAWGMAYGALAVAAIGLVSGVRWILDPTLIYVGSLIYLSLFGSVVAFVAYLTLLGNIGAGPAGYISVAVPLVALIFSTVFEGYRWQLSGVIGAILCIAGNLLVLLPQRATSAASSGIAARP